MSTAWRRIRMLVFLMGGSTLPFACRSLPKPEFELATLETNLLDADQYPEVVLVTVGSGQHACTGAFVSPQQILAPAHCVAMAGANLDAIRLEPQISSILKVEVHPSYGTSTAELRGAFDLAVLTLADETAPAVAPMSRLELRVGDPVSDLAVEASGPERLKKRRHLHQLAKREAGFLVVHRFSDDSQKVDIPGALFYAGQLVGLYARSQVATDETVIQYIDLQNRELQSFLNEKIKM